jgi:hypothetical protein
MREYLLVELFTGLGERPRIPVSSLARLDFHGLFESGYKFGVSEHAFPTSRSVERL